MIVVTLHQNCQKVVGPWGPSCFVLHIVILVIPNLRKLNTVNKNVQNVNVGDR